MRSPFAPVSATDADGFAQFVADRRAPLLAMARGLVRSEEDAADLVQDVLAKALLKWEVVAASEQPAAYVNRMLVNRAISRWRRSGRREVPASDAWLAEASEAVAARGGSGADPVETLVERDALVRGLRSLPPRHRAVLVLRFYEGLPDTEIAALLDMAAPTVRSSAARGLAALRRVGLLDPEPSR